MSLSKKFVIMLIVSVVSIAILNIATFYGLYSYFIRLYLSEKIESRQDVTIEFINNIIERQTLEDVDTIFSDVEIEFFELLDINNWVIPLAKDENINIVVDYLVKSWVTPKYIEEIIPENNLEKIVTLLRDPDSPESNFVQRLLFSLVIINFLILSFLAIIIWYFTKKIISPIQKATREIQSMKYWYTNSEIHYDKKDEIWLLIQSINNLNKRLSYQENIRNRLLADISHELKTPITSIQCYLEWISDGVIELTEANLWAITSEMTRLIELVNQIMEYEKFENAQLELSKNSVNPLDLLNQVKETQEVYLQEKNQTIILNGSRNIEIFLDESLFIQLAYNLIWNFIKYAWVDSTLCIELDSQSIKFSDNWNGISKREIPFITEKFYQGKTEKTWNAKSRWIGVWLSIVKKICEAHNWDYKIDSDTWVWFSIMITF